MSPFAKLLLVLLPCVAIAGFLLHRFQFAEPAAGSLRVTLEPAYPKLPKFDHPLLMRHAGDGTDRIFVVSKPGMIHVFPNDPAVEQATKFLDISDKVIQWHNEEGLLGLAFDPDYTTNGFFYIHYSRAGEGRRERWGRISRFRVSTDDPNRADRDSELILFEIKQPWGNHNGGCLEFGPDGYLYFSLGDGGAAGDRLNAGQDLGTLLATICRVDVRGATKEKPYTIPADNPFVNTEGAKPEIWAWGLRNVWRFTFDRQTGDLWAGDVGQNTWEEIDLITKGGNYGWRAFEADMVFDRALAESDAAKSMIKPIVAHPRSEAKSITGGYVYRGTKEPKLQGLYIYGDYVSRFIWALAYDREAKTVIAHDYIGKLENALLPSFGEDEAGELYVVGFDGRIYRVTVAPPANNPK